MIETLIKDRDQLRAQEKRLENLVRKLQDNWTVAKVETPQVKLSFWRKAAYGGTGSTRFDELDASELYELRLFLQEKLEKVVALRREKERMISTAEQILKQAQL